MSQQLIANITIVIHASAEKTWEVLTKPAYIQQWDDLPEDFGTEDLFLGAVMEWPGSAILEVNIFEPGKQLRLSFYDPKWDQLPGVYHTGYTYSLNQENNHTLLTIEAGDFGQVNGGEKHYEAAVDFVATAAQKIKELAEA